MKNIFAILVLVLMTLPVFAGFRAYNGTTDLGIYSSFKCSTGLTCTKNTQGLVTMTSSPTISTGTLSISGAEATDALLYLKADESDDNGDDWLISSVASGNALTFSNDTSGAQVVKMTLSTAGALSGYKQAQVASTTASLTEAQCGSTIVSNSADVMTLPEASTVLGCRYTFVCGTADDLDINPADGTDQIGPALNSVAGGTGAAITPSAGDAIRCTDIGSSITLEAVGANLWAPIGVANGAWTDIN